MKTLTWTTEEEAKVLVGKRVRMTEKHLRGLHWSQAMEWTGVYTITDAYNKKAVIEIPNYGSHCVASGDLLLAEPEAAPLPLEKIAVRVEDRAEVEAFIAWGEARNIPMWPGDKETFRTMTEGHCFPAGVRGGYLCAWNTKIPTGLTILSLATFLRDYPAPQVEPKYPYLKDWKPGERVRESSTCKAGVVMWPGDSHDNHEIFWENVKALALIPIRLEDAYDGRYCFSVSERFLTRLPPQAPKPEPVVPLKITDPPDWTCPHCGKAYPGRVWKFGFAFVGFVETWACRPCVQRLLESAGWIKPPRRQTRLEAIMEMGKRSYTSEIVHKHYPRGGDR